MTSIITTKRGTLTVPLTMTRLSTDPEAPLVVDCLVCEAALLLHQPDLHDPDRLLGTCDLCGSWHLIDGDAAVAVLLPDPVGLLALRPVPLGS